MNRRNLLKGIFISSAITYPVYRLLSALIKEDKFQPLGVPKVSKTRNYIQFNFYGGPTRWCYDHFLNPYGSEFIQNPMTFNQFDPTSPLDQQKLYQFEYKKTHVPLLWSEELHSKRKMTNLLDNSLTIRGVHLEGTTGHPMNSSKMIAPGIGGYSIDGLLADLSKKPLTSITVGDTPVNRAFKSRASSNIKVKGDIENHLDYILSPFYLKTGDKENSKEMEELLDNAINILNQSETSKNLKSDLKRARIFFKESIEAFLAEYDSLILKYQEIIAAGLKHKIKGVDDKAIPTPSLPLTLDGDIEIEDALGPYKVNNIYILSEDLRQLLDSANVGKLAQNFALAEFISKYGLSSSIVFANKNEIGEIFRNVSAKTSYKEESLKKSYDKITNKTTITSTSAPGLERPQLSFDSHSTGSLINLLTCSKFFYIFSSCLDELINVLKATKLDNHKSLFEETIIHVTSEFDRVPKNSLSGSDHNEQAHVSTFYSGIIQGPIVLGNILVGSHQRDKNWGTIGNSAPVSSLNSKIGISHVSSTLSSLLRIPPIIKRSPSLIKVEKGRAIPIVELAKNIGENHETYNS
ncbi:hypothetical protein [Halobacteriovorax sp. JY17]|uniref:hypothetical protein n=1 Tax=Halobacteriovorax sp. JY17 TaxID=2014617 RepID=UPI0025C3ECA1|nr:hypothetical protein [Halobacteriovorax sp. JY17]